MAFVPVPFVAQCVVHQVLDSQVVQNTLYFRHTTGAISALELTTIANQLRGYWLTNMIPIQSAQLVLNQVSARDLGADSGLIAESFGGPDNGGGSNDFLPNNVAACISFRTGLAGKSFRGRNYFAGLTEQVVTANLVDAATMAAIVDAYQGMAGVGVVAVNWEWVVVSRFTGGAPRAEGVATPILTALAVDNVVDSQRRRLPRRGA